MSPRKTIEQELEELRWWEPRREGELTTEFLGRVLDEVGLADMARRAREGHFDDYFAPADVADGLELLRLVTELNAAAELPATKRNDRPRIRAIREAVKCGEFDGTIEESDRWAASKDGQDTYKQLAEGR